MAHFGRLGRESRPFLLFRLDAAGSPLRALATSVLPRQTLAKEGIMKALRLVILSICVALPAHAQKPVSGNQPPAQSEGASPIFKLVVNVVERTTKAINYRHHSGATKIDFRGTPLLPDARGEAKVESKSGYIEIE